MTDLEDDLFQPAETEPIYGIRAGRYRYPAPPGEAESSNGWMRTSNLVAAFSDQERLQLWLAWKMMIGLRMDDGLLFDEWMAAPLSGLTLEQEKALANEWADRARDRGGAKDAARRGTARHAMMETYLGGGERTGTRSMQIQMDDVLELLDALDYDVVPGSLEQRLWNPIAGGTMGTSDARVMCRRTGQSGILDWKTQARFWTFQEICGQLCCYDSAPYRWLGPPSELGQWVAAAPNDLTGRPGTRLAGQRVALVAHMPLGGPVAVKQVSLAYGRDVLECAARNVELRSIGRSSSSARMPAEDLTP